MESGEGSDKTDRVLSWDDVARLALRVLLSKYPDRRDDCEEAVQQMVLQSLQAKSRHEAYRNLQPSAGWAITLAFRCLIDIYRRDGRYEKVELPEDAAIALPFEADSDFFSGPFIELSDPFTGSEDESDDRDSDVEHAVLARKEAVELLDRILTPNEALVMKLTTWHEWSSQRISAVMKVPPGTVRFWRAQALDRLRKHFGLKAKGKGL